MTIIEIDNILEKCKKLGFKNFTIEELINAFIIYLRKSRKDEEIERYIKMENPNVTKEELDKEILKRHELQIQAYAKETLGFKIPDKNIIRELKSGGELSERLEMQKVLREIENPNILGVLVYDIDRIGRPNALDTGIIIQAFELTDTKIFVATPPKIWDLTDEFDREYFEDSLRQARKFLNYTKTKMTNGRKQSVREGCFIGNTAPFGYDRYKLPNRKGYSLTQNDNAKYVKLIFDMYVNQNKSVREIARYLNENEIKPPVKDYWQPSMITNLMKKDAYAGYVTYGKSAYKSTMKNGKKIKKRAWQDDYLKCKGLHEAIVDEDIFNKAQTIGKERQFKNVPNEFSLKNPLSGLIRCRCGYSIVKKKDRVKIYSYNKDKVNPLEFKSYFLERKKALNYNYEELSNLTGLHPTTLKKYGDKKTSHLPTSKNFKKIKEILKMDNRLDNLIKVEKGITYRDTYYCTNFICTCVSASVEDVEKELIKQLRLKLKGNNYILDNYEQDEVKIIKDNKKDIEKLKSEIEGLKTQISVACDMLERKIYTDDIFLSRINELNNKIAIKEEKIKELKGIEVETEIIQNKRQVPILENVINHYDELDPVEKNELLKSFINKITYFKETKASNKTLKDSGKIELDIDFKEF